MITKPTKKKTKQYIQGPLEVTKEDQMHVAELVDALCTGPSCVVDTPAQLDDCGPNLDIQHAAFVQKQHLPSAPLSKLSMEKLLKACLRVAEPSCSTTPELLGYRSS